MARGSNAKNVVENKIREVFGSDFVGVSDKKLYVWADDGGERVQIAISLTCPKVFIEQNAAPVVDNELNFEEMSGQTSSNSYSKPLEVTSEETENIRKMLKALDL